MHAPSLENTLREAARHFDIPNEVFAIIEPLIRDTAREVLEALPTHERDMVRQTILARYEAEDRRVARSRQHLRDGTHDPEWQAQLDKINADIPRLYNGIPYEEDQ